jgi:hypothetical protein
MKRVIVLVDYAIGALLVVFSIGYLVVNILSLLSDSNLVIVGFFILGFALVFNFAFIILPILIGLIVVLIGQYFSKDSRLGVAISSSLLGVAGIAGIFIPFARDKIFFADLIFKNMPVLPILCLAVSILNILVLLVLAYSKRPNKADEALSN